jgi:tRNA C32,U32 (ribose-2'-O)-methylase TrmJ
VSGPRGFSAEEERRICDGIRSLIARVESAEAEVARLRDVLQKVYDAELDDARERWDAEQLMAGVLFREGA